MRNDAFVMVGDSRPSTPFPVVAPQGVDGRPSPTMTTSIMEAV
jgi:hypothetical protein